MTNILGPALVLLSSAASARAAPQILGVVATAEPLNLQCSDNRCEVEVPTLCLEAKRETPLAGRVYKPMDSKVFSVVARNSAGKMVHVPLPEATFRVARGYTASRVVLATSGLRARGLMPVALSVTAGTILLPAPIKGDTNPITQAEISRVKDTLWPLAERVFQKRRQKVETVGMVNRLLNQAPVAGPMTASQRKDLWSTTFGTSPMAATGGATGQAVAALGTCQRIVAKGLIFTLRECLATRVDSLLTDIDVAYWREASHGGT
ncbi:hypothetical protein [Solirhodobacter olei]|uniref:hypothetical protein n=1 Tax=Solirhodobacter olei TaxID=2493082 RepID=UPI000FD8C29C|nr:hypothetical protein [Solirhodobacter olei]